MKHKSSNDSQNYSNPSPINTRKINALSRAYENLPSSGFSKLVVTFCIFFAVIVIITSFILLYFGYDTSDLLQSVLLFLGGELLCLSLTTTLKREQTKNEILFSQIEKDINDGYLYDANGNIVGKEGQMLNTNTNTNTGNTTTNTGNMTNNYYSVTNTNTNTNNSNNSNNFQEPQDDSSFYNTNPDPSEAQGSDEEFEEENTEGSQEEEIQEEPVEEQPKPQPKKRGRPKKSTQVKQPKQEEEEFVSDWLDEDMSD